MVMFLVEPRPTTTYSTGSSQPFSQKSELIEKHPSNMSKCMTPCCICWQPVELQPNLPPATSAFLFNQAIFFCTQNLKTISKNRQTYQASIMYEEENSGLVLACRQEMALILPFNKLGNVFRCQRCQWLNL